MEELLFHNSTIVSVSLGICAVLAAIGAMIVARKTLLMSKRGIRHFLEFRFRPTALRYTDELECLVEGFREKVTTLERYNREYSALFNEAKWTKLTITLDEVSRAHEELCALLEQRESKDALCLAEFLIAAGEDLAPWKYRHISDEWAPLATWELDVHTILTKVVNKLWEETQTGRTLGTLRGTNVHETRKVLEKIREEL
jgi:hypothetical protein